MACKGWSIRAGGPGCSHATSSACAASINDAGADGSRRPFEGVRQAIGFGVQSRKAARNLTAKVSVAVVKHPQQGPVERCVPHEACHARGGIHPEVRAVHRQGWMPHGPWGLRGSGADSGAIQRASVAHLPQDRGFTDDRSCQASAFPVTSHGVGGHGNDGQGVQVGPLARAGGTVAVSTGIWQSMSTTAKSASLIR